MQFVQLAPVKPSPPGIAGNSLWKRVILQLTQGARQNGVSVTVGAAVEQALSMPDPELA
jgi:hypothetical protein